MTRLELAIGMVLRLGTVVSSSLLAIGLVMGLAGYRGALTRMLLDMGLVILLATPAARVVVSVIAYMRERDWTFVVLTLVVLLALGASVVAAYL
ncbi:MAG TPA: DUF1634 domain-containing protein [Vicinamibacterales bacterium]|jgi:uncharacterized membrane protein